ncbi:hypothetical protein AYK26_02940 [Euryarchaeota archaeon SM23-78]|nr:MAG: hypothetical protein AYK26_02940 [Euryarchaeota archaeon SM23-78]MBW3000399.1 hypothetical protein [Candidatus Woesearchaeota archaeon]
MFSFDWVEALATIQPVISFLLGMAVYSIFIFHFYRFVAKKDIFNLNLSQYNYAKLPLIKKFFGLILYIIEYILIFPLFAFFWFAILTVLLTFLAKEPVVQSILMISVATIGAIRFTAYYNEDLSKDLAKMLPFALLGIYLIDAAYFSFAKSWEFIKQIPSDINIILYYMIFIIFLEFFLRIATLILKKKPKAVQEEEETK